MPGGWGDAGGGGGGGRVKEEGEEDERRSRSTKEGGGHSPTSGTPGLLASYPGLLTPVLAVLTADDKHWGEKAWVLGYLLSFW